MTELKVLELFSGIGGMHFALKESKIPAFVVGAMEINPVANSVYKHNYPEVNLNNNNIQCLNEKMVSKLSANTILMSPPCQPFTRNGNFGDIEDNRSDAFKHICNMIETNQLPGIQHVLMENVKGFEVSKARELYIAALETAGFQYQEFILTPTQWMIPNSRSRYYCVARRTKPFTFKSKEILYELPSQNKSMESTNGIESYTISNQENLERYLLSDKILENRFNVLDICTNDSTNSMCFTKSYSRYLEGTGSVYTNHSDDTLKKIINQIESCDDKDECLKLKKSLKLRFFTPQEVAKLMCFPESFQFPPETTDKQKYRLLGNSINVRVVSELIRFMVAG